MNVAYKSRLLAEARGDVNLALDIALARMAVLESCVSGGYVRAGEKWPIERISGEVELHAGTDEAISDAV